MTHWAICISVKSGSTTFLVQHFAAGTVVSILPYHTAPRRKFRVVIKTGGILVPGVPDVRVQCHIECHGPRVREQ